METKYFFQFQLILRENCELYEKRKTHSHLSPANGGNNQLALISSIKPGGSDYINKSTPPLLFSPKKLHKATKKVYTRKRFAVSNPFQSSSTAITTFTNSTYMRIPMLHTPSAAGRNCTLSRPKPQALQYCHAQGGILT